MCSTQTRRIFETRDSARSAGIETARCSPAPPRPIHQRPSGGLSVATILLVPVRRRGPRLIGPSRCSAGRRRTRGRRRRRCGRRARPRNSFPYRCDGARRAASSAPGGPFAFAARARCERGAAPRRWRRRARKCCVDSVCFANTFVPTAHTRLQPPSLLVSYRTLGPVTKVGEPRRAAQKPELHWHSTAKTHRNWSEAPALTIRSPCTQAVCPRTAALDLAEVIKQC